MEASSPVASIVVGHFWTVVLRLYSRQTQSSALLLCWLSLRGDRFSDWLSGE